MQLAYKREATFESEMRSETLLETVEGGGQQRSDEELVIAAQNGESCALGELFGRHQKMLYRSARRYTANADEAYDLVQEAMLRAFTNMNRFRRESQFASGNFATRNSAGSSIPRMPGDCRHTAREWKVPLDTVSATSPIPTSRIVSARSIPLAGGPPFSLRTSPIPAWATNSITSSSSRQGA